MIMALLLATSLVCLILAISIEVRRRREKYDLESKVFHLLNQNSTHLDDEMALGQSLSCLVIQLDVARKLREVKPSQSGAALEQAKFLAGTSLQRVRERLHKRRQSRI